MKRLKDANLVAFGQHLSAEQIKRSGVLRRLAEGSSVEPSAIVALLPQEEFVAWSQFHQVQNPSIDQLKAVLQAATVLEDRETITAASRRLAQGIRASFRETLPGSPLEQLRSIPAGEPSLPVEDRHSASPSLLPASGYSSAADAAYTLPASSSGHGSSTPGAGLRRSFGPSIAGSGVGSSSAPIADTLRLIRAGGGSGSCSGADLDDQPGAGAVRVPGGDPVSGAGLGPLPPPTPFARLSPAAATSSAENTLPSASNSGFQPPGSSYNFPSRSTLDTLTSLSPEALKATLYHLHLSISLHLPRHLCIAALQCRATHALSARPNSDLDLSGTLTAIRTMPFPPRSTLAHPVISTFAVLLPAAMPHLRFLSLSNNHLIPADAVALSSALSTLPSLAALDLSDNLSLTTAAATGMLCSCPNLRTSLTSLCLAGCNRAHPAVLARALTHLDALAHLTFGPAPPRMGEMPLLTPLAKPLSRLHTLESLRLCGFGSALLELIPRLPFETLTSLDVGSEEEVVAPIHAALAEQAGRMHAMRRLRLCGWACATVDSLSIDRFVRAVAALPHLAELSMSGAPPHNPDLSALTRVTTLTAVTFKNMSRHLIIPVMRHLPLLRNYCCVKCHSPPVKVYQAVATSGAAIFGAMRDVSLVHCDMDSHERQVTFRHLCGMSHLLSLRITYPIGGNLSYFPRISELQKFLPTMPGLTRLELSCCHRFHTDAAAPALDFSNLAALEVLAVTAVDRSESATQHSFPTSAFRGLGTLTALRTLDVSHTALADLPAFVAELAPLSRLTALCLLGTAPAAAVQACDWTGASTASRLADSLAPLTGLKELTLSFVPLGDAGAATLAPALGRMLRLEHLGMLKTGVTDVGAAALWSHLRSLPLNRKVLINSAAPPGPSAAAESALSESVAVAQGHSGFPYPMV